MSSYKSGQNAISIKDRIKLFENNSNDSVKVVKTVRSVKKLNVKEFNVKESNVKESNVKESNVKESNVKESNVKEFNVKQYNVKEPNVKDVQELSKIFEQKNTNLEEIEKEVYRRLNEIKIKNKDLFKIIQKYVCPNDCCNDQEEKIVDNIKVENFVNDLNKPEKEIVQDESVALQEESKAVNTIQKIIEEIINTEVSYLKNLKIILIDYKEILEEMQKDPKILDHINDIYEKSQEFLQTLQSCSLDYEKVGEEFLNFENLLFTYYPFVLKDLPLANKFLALPSTVLKTTKLENNLPGLPKLQTCFYEITRRLGNYILFLGRIDKELKKQDEFSEKISEAIKMVQSQMKTSDTYIAIDSIENIPLTFADTGVLKIKGKFSVTKPSRYKAIVYLFDDYLVIARIEEREKEEILVYEDHIAKDYLMFNPYYESTDKFQVLRKKAYGDHEKFNLTCIDFKEKEKWLQELSDLGECIVKK